MDAELKKVKDILIKYNQEHLIQFYDELDDWEKGYLTKQILSIDFDEILDLYDKSKFDVLDSTEEIAPLEYMDKSTLSSNKLDYFSKIGENAISSGKVGVITLAGGQGSRLGFKGPKGTFMLDTKPKISLFEVLCKYIMDTSDKYSVEIMWYIMTSTENYDATISFFEKNNFFGYNKNNIVFFKQGNLPIIDTQGKLVLEELYKVKIASNGNGDLFHSLKQYGLLENMSKKGIEWLFVGGVDNVLLNPLDTVFIGATIDSNKPIASKTLFKDDPTNIAWIFARKNDKPAIVDCENFVEELSNVRDDSGKYLYREVNMLAHLFSLDAIKKVCDSSFPYHRAFRKSPFVNYEGMKQVPNSPNIYKFEKFVFDAFSYFDDMFLLRVDAGDEFAPIKDFNGPHNPEVAKKLYEQKVLHIESIDED